MSNILADFATAHAFTAQWEGGLTDHPADPGGLTNYGVSLRWLKDLGIVCGDIDHDGDIDADDVRALTPEKAADLFRRKFWDVYRLGELPQIMADVVYDCMVNTGPGQTARIAQRAFNAECLPGPAPLQVDGVFGPATREALRLGAGKPLALGLIMERERFYRNLVYSNPGFQPFLKGWLNRCTALRRFVGVLS